MRNFIQIDMDVYAQYELTYFTNLRETFQFHFLQVPAKISNNYKHMYVVLYLHIEGRG